jgi:hypothetical protein
MRLAGLGQRVFYERLKGRGVPIFADQADRRRRWILRDDVEKLAEPVARRRKVAD